ncbi:hypothetical protein BFJ72_g13071 [Fusarium proliferatum]|uniref:FAD-binding domain-containing protein n=1 Tax=Gibberella intermedia TaxID=948311 RepID=A0A420SE23_GIBIN|nr:hypothetical protein BFJ72_g13071 [Fusarium proliferatum]
MAHAQSSFKVIIIGSGLAGSLLANGLIHKDVDVRVYERLERHAKREGYQIRLGAPALKGMRACLNEQQIKAIVDKFGRSGGVRSSAPVLYDKNFKELVDLTVFPSYSKSAPIKRGILRDLLADPVYEAGKLQYGRAFTRYEILDPGTATERVRVWFDDGSSDECDVLIGADGSNSKVNLQLGLDNIKQITSHVSLIAKQELPNSRLRQMSPQLQQKPVMTFADRKSFFYAAYLPDKIEEGGTKTGSSIDDSISAMMFGVQVPTEECPPNLANYSSEEKFNFVLSAFRGWSKEQGMGGNQSLCDTATALPILSELSASKATGAADMRKKIQEGCEAYEREMIPRAFEWVEKSGGSNIQPIDSSTVGGKCLFLLARLAMTFTWAWYSFIGLFFTHEIVDDAPELRT